MAAPIEVPSFDELYETGKAVALLRSSKITDRSFSPGYMLDLVAGLSAALSQEALRIAVEQHLRTFIATAAGDDLDRLVEDHFGITRQAGVAAFGTVTFSRPSAAFGNLSIASGTVVKTSDGTEFETTAGVVLTGTEIDAGVMARETGEGGNVAAGTLTVLDVPLADTTVTVTNAEEMSAGIDQETDSALRSRALAYLQTLRRATKLALETGAKSVAGVVSATVDESSYPPTVYIADATGSANSALEAAVQAELVNWRAAGISVNVVGATVLFQDITLALTFRAGYDTATVRDQVRAAVVAEVNALDIGDTLYRARVAAAALSITGIANAVVSNPAGDVAPSANQLIRTETTRVTI